MGERVGHEQAILAEIPWLRQLARDLTSDVAGRDDLVQETCWIALTRPPRDRERASLRAWLRTVIRNVSLLTQRSRLRAEVRERSNAREEAIEPVDEIVARAELQRRLLAEVLALRRPLREVLILRYYRGLDTTTIARELKLTVEAVRQRQVRALAALRDRTRDDADLRDLMSVAGVLRPATRGSAHTLRWAAAACCALIAAVWVPLALSCNSASGARPILSVPSVTVAEISDTSANSATESGTREPVQEPTPIAPWLTLQVREARDHAALADVSIARARAKNWDELAADVDSTFDRLGISGSAGHFLSLSNEESLPAQPGTENAPPFSPRDESVIAKTDRQGSAALSAKLPAEEFLVIRCAGHGARFIAVADALRLAPKALIVDMHPLGKLPVSVHTLEGEAIDDAFLRLEAVPFMPEFQPQATLPLVDGLAWHGPTDEHGKFNLEDVPLDESMIVTPLSRCIGSPMDLLLPAGSSIRPLDLVVVASGAICGRLVDGKGHPIADGTVLCRPRRPWYEHYAQCSTDADGAFSLPMLPAGTQTLEYSAKPSSQVEFMFADWTRDVEVEPSANIDVGELVLDAKSICSGRVIGFVDHAKLQVRLELIQKDQRTLATFAENGSFEVPGEAGPARIELTLGTDWGPGRLLEGREVVLPCENIELDVTKKLASLAFRLGDDSEGLPKVAVRLYDRNNPAADASLHWESADSRYEIEAENGAYRVEALFPGKFRAEIHGPGGHDAWTGDIELAAGHVLDLGSLRFGSGTVEGILRGAHGRCDVHCVRRAVSNWGRDDFDARSTPLGDDGSFKFNLLPAGTWCFTATCDGDEVSDGVVVDLRADKTEHLDLTASHAGKVRCRIRNAGVPVVGALAQYSFSTEGEMRPFFELNPRTKLRASDIEGRIDLGSFFPGGYLVSVQVGDFRMARHVDIHWGEQIELEFETGWPEVEVSLKLPDDWEARMYGLTFYSLDVEGPVTRCMLPARRTGVSTWLLRAPPAKGYLELDLQHGADTQTVQLPLTIRAGQARVALELPPGELLIRVGDEHESWGLPDVCAVELPTGKIPGDDSFLDSWPLESLGDGRWLARGIPAGATLRLQDVFRGNGQGPVPRFVHFESGRLEMQWP